MDEKKRILVVDDEEFNVAILEELLEDEGFEIASAFSGESAIELFNEFKPHLVLLDVMMPGINGYEACRRIRAFGDNQIPIVFLSAKAYLEDKLKGYEAGGDDYITKPFTNEELIAKVTVLLTKKQQIEQLEQSSAEAATLAYSLMTSSSKVGFISRFVSESIRCSDVASLCELFFKTTKEGFGMHGLIRVVSGSGILLASDDGDIRALDREIIESCQTEKRITQFGKDRALFTWGDVSLLVRNLREDVDTLAILLDGFCSSLNAIESRNEMLSLVDEFHEKNILLKEQAMLLLDDLSDDLRDLFASSGAGSNLSEEEEEGLVKVVEKTSDRLHQLLADGDVMELRLATALKKHEAANAPPESVEGPELF
jgi:CheY-like chemotaxis protein